MSKRKSVKRKYFNKYEAEKQFKDKTIKGEVVDVSQENPIIKPFRNAPNIIVENLSSHNFSEGDVLEATVNKCMEGYMFGRAEEREIDEAEVYEVSFSLAGYTFSAEFSDEETAEDVKKLLSQIWDFSSLEMRRLR